jgi:arabinose-5-phosphate isomerase
MHAAVDVPLVRAGTSMGEALLMMSQKGFGVVGVTDADDYLIGIVTDGDLRRHMDGLLDHTADQVMTPKPRTIGPDVLAEKAVFEMNARKITTLFVVEAGADTSAAAGAAAGARVVGLINIHDCLRAGVV